MYENRDKGIQGYSHKDIRGCKDTGIPGRGYKKAECKDTVRQENTGKMLQDTGKWTSGIQENAAPEI